MRNGFQLVISSDARPSNRLDSVTDRDCSTVTFKFAGSAYCSERRCIIGSPETTICAIPVLRFDKFTRGLEALKAKRSTAAWLSFFESFEYYPAETTSDLVEQRVIADGAEPDWYNEALVASLVGTLEEGCPSVFINDGLIRDMWECKYEFIHLLHEACACPEEHLQACLLRLILFDRYMLSVAIENADGLPAALSAHGRWAKEQDSLLRELVLSPSERYAGYHKDNLDRETASRVVFQYRYPCGLLVVNRIADESLLSPDQAAQLARASDVGGLFERFRRALPPEFEQPPPALPSEAEWVRRDIANLADFLQGLSEPYPYLYSVAYGT